MAFYTPSGTVAQYELRKMSAVTIAVTTTQGDKALGSITLPATLWGSIKAVYADLWIVRSDGTSSRINQVTTIEVSDGASTITAETTIDQCFYAATANVVGGGFFLPLTADLSSIAVGGATLTFTWKNAKVSTNTTFKDVIIILHFITG